MALSYNLAYQEIISVHPTRRQIFADKSDSTFWNIWEWVIYLLLLCVKMNWTSGILSQLQSAALPLLLRRCRPQRKWCGPLCLHRIQESDKYFECNSTFTMNLITSIYFKDDNSALDQTIYSRKIFYTGRSAQIFARQEEQQALCGLNLNWRATQRFATARWERFSAAFWVLSFCFKTAVFEEHRTDF